MFNILSLSDRFPNLPIEIYDMFELSEIDTICQFYNFHFAGLKKSKRIQLFRITLEVDNNVTMRLWFAEGGMEAQRVKDSPGHPLAISLSEKEAVIDAINTLRWKKKQYQRTKEF